MSDPCRSLGMAPYNTAELSSTLEILTKKLEAIQVSEAERVTDKFIETFKILQGEYQSYLEWYNNDFNPIAKWFGKQVGDMSGAIRRLSYHQTYFGVLKPDGKGTDILKYDLPLSDFKRNTATRIKAAKMKDSHVLKWIQDIVDIDIEVLKHEVGLLYNVRGTDESVGISKVPNIIAANAIKYLKGLIPLSHSAVNLNDTCLKIRNLYKFIDFLNCGETYVTPKMGSADELLDTLRDTLTHTREQVHINSKAKTLDGTAFVYYVSNDLQKSITKARNI